VGRRGSKARKHDEKGERIYRVGVLLNSYRFFYHLGADGRWEGERKARHVYKRESEGGRDLNEVKTANFSLVRAKVVEQGNDGGMLPRCGTTKGEKLKREGIFASPRNDRGTAYHGDLKEHPRKG